MLALLVSPSFLPPTPRYEAIGRRDVLAAAGLAATVLPAPAFAQRSKLVPKSSKESTESYKQFQLSTPKGETEAFKLAEARRKSFESGGSKGPESAADEMKRLGLATYADSASKGFTYDPNRR